jgi:hypothetical protein
MSRWMKGPPSAEGSYWYWLLGSGTVRSQDVFRSHGDWHTALHLVRDHQRDHPGVPLPPGELCICNNEQGPFSVKRPLRLWARGTTRPPLPSDDEMAALDARRKG